jgi:ATP-dependent helicase/nuclease subunit A
MSLTPTPDQKRATDPQSSIWVAANAGSGKTHVLVERVIRLLLQGAEPAAILCITYTKAAAAEMSARLFKRLGSWAALDDITLSSELATLGLINVNQDTLSDARRLFTRALETPGGLKIQTIHAFCEKLLHLFPVEAGLAPGFKVLDSRSSQDLRSEAIQKIMNASSVYFNANLHASLNAIGELTNSDSFARVIEEFLNSTKGVNFLFNADLEADSFALALKNELGLSPDEDQDFVKCEIAKIDSTQFLHHASVLKPIKMHRTHDTAAWLAAATHSNDRVQALKKLFLTANGSDFRADFMAKKTAETYPETAAFMKSEKLRLEPLFEKLKLTERLEATTHLFTVTKPIYAEIEQQKKLKGHYDFGDLIDRCAKLLGNSRAAHWVLYKLDSGLKHILVDEAQDTNHAQWQIIKALSDEFYASEKSAGQNARTLFVVGDRKQSIFSFQGADVAAFNSARASFATKITGAGAKFESVDLTVSYRSTAQVLEAVDQVFPASSPEKFGFAQDEFIERGHTTVRKDEAGIFEIWPLYESLEREEEEPWIAPVDREPAASPRRRLARDIVLTIRTWIDRRYLQSTKRNVKPQDILILLQSRGPLFAMLIAELRKAHIPVAGADRLKLLESLAVKDLLALLQWLSLPSDDYSLACILKSPLMPQPLNEDQLFELAYRRGTESLWSRMQAQPDKNVEYLRDIEKQSSKLGPYALLARVLLRARKPMIARLGAESEDATDALLDQAMAYELEHAPSLAGFLHWIMAEEIDVKREMEQDSGEVRLMTVHGAKGLEANIVFLPDAGSIPKSNRTAAQILQLPVKGRNFTLPFWRATGEEKPLIQCTLDDVEKQRVNAERNRLLYVAMTRACDELYVCGIGSKGQAEIGSWYETIVNAIGKDEASNGLRLGPELVFGDSEIELPNEEAKRPDWIFRQAPTETGLSRIYSLTGLVSRHMSKQSTYDITAAKRGVAIHALLQGLPDIVPERRENYVRRKARNLGLGEDQVLSLITLINKAELAEFFGPNSRSEVELRGRLEDGRQVIGRVDRIAVLPEVIYVLDYKSDIHVPEHLTSDHAYAQQMGLYALLLEQAYPMRKINVALLWTQNSKLEWLLPDFLTQACDLALNKLESEAS